MTTAGITEDQLDWLDTACAYITGTLGYTPSKFIAFHIPIVEFSAQPTPQLFIIHYSIFIGAACAYNHFTNYAVSICK